MDDPLKIAREAYESSTSYVDANYRKRWATNLSLFQSKHPDGSKYNSEAYRYRSQIFRPKTRSFVRRLGASAASAYFSNMDVITVEPTNPKNPAMVMSAKVTKELLQYRLTKTIPWFLTVIGALQDASVIGVVCSHQCWKYREKKIARSVPMINPYTGEPMMNDLMQPAMQEVYDREILQDEPSIELVAIENLRIDPGANWIDPIGTSPYIIELIPMYAGDVKQMSETDDSKTGAPAWAPVTDGELTAAMSAYDVTRQKRESPREDPDIQVKPITDFDIVWVHRNIIRDKGEDFVYYTLGTTKLLTEPKPLKEVYFTGERPYVMGFTEIETHKIYPSAPVELGEQTQREANEIANSRLDNVKLVLNKRYLAKRGAQVDLKSLVRNAAGSVTLVTDPEKDVRELNWPDVTGSAYMEQDRINVDFDEILGNFSSGSVQTNRKMNETVGGMNLLSQSANVITDFTLRIFNESWVEPVLRQLANLEQHYETDGTIMALIGDRTGIQIRDGMVNADLQINVNVGMGATDPVQRMNRLLAGVKVIGEIPPQAEERLEVMEIIKEVFGFMGYRDGGRFAKDGPDPRLMKASQIIQQLQQQLNDKAVDLRAQMVQQKMLLDSKERMHHEDLVVNVNELGAQIELWQAQTLKTLSEAMTAQTEMNGDVKGEVRNAVVPMYQGMEALAQINNEQYQNVTRMITQATETATGAAQQIAALQQNMDAQAQEAAKPKPPKKRIVKYKGKEIPVEIAEA